MKPIKLLAAASAVFIAPFLPATSWAADEHGKHHADQPAVSTTVIDAAGMSDGEVRKVDKDAKKITLKHGAIKNLGMPAMTMVFQVQDAALLDKVNAGDRVRFSTGKIAGGYVVTAIEVSK